MTNFSGKNLNAACGGSQGGGVNSRRNTGVAEVSPKYLAEAASHTIPVGYKQTEVGVIPEDWFIEPLEEFTSFISYGFTNPMPTTHVGPYMITARDISDGKVQYKNARTTDIDAFNKLLTSKSRPKKNDLLLTKDGTLGRLALVEDEQICINQSVAILRPNQRIVPLFFKLLLESPYYQERMIEEAGGSTIKHIYITIVNRMPLSVPSDTKEQTAIAKALSDVDALISELEKLIAKKQAIKTATMQQLLTGRTRLPQFAVRTDGTPNGTKPSELGEIPEDWEVVPLGSLASVKTGSKNNQDKVADGLFPFFVRSEHVERLNSYSYDCEAILVPGEGGIGNIFHYISGKFDAHQRVYVIRNFEKCVGKYIYFQMRKSFGSHAMENSVKATVDSLRLPTFLEFRVLLPSEEEQTAIATILSDMDEEIQALEHRRSKTRQIKQGMMQELLTGKTKLLQGVVND